MVNPIKVFVSVGREIVIVQDEKRSLLHGENLLSRLIREKVLLLEDRRGVIKGTEVSNDSFLLHSIAVRTRDGVFKDRFIDGLSALVVTLDIQVVSPITQGHFSYTLDEDGVFDNVLDLH